MSYRVISAALFKGNAVKILIMSIILIFVAGCSTHSLFVNNPIKNELLIKKLEKPYINKFDSEKYNPTQSENIQLFFMRFSSTNQPNLYQNWAYHYKLGNPSEPNWNYKKIAEVVIYLRSPENIVNLPKLDDKPALTEIKNIAANLGGDAVINMYRKPITLKSNLGTVVAYSYYGLVVKKLSEN